MDHVVEQRDLAVGVSDDRKVHRRLLRVVDVVDPFFVRLDRIDRQRDDLHMAFRKLVFQLGRHAELGGAYGCEIGRVRKQDAPTVAQPFVKVNATLGRILFEIGRRVSKS